jgi:signal peptidase II
MNESARKPADDGSARNAGPLAFPPLPVVWLLVSVAVVALDLYTKQLASAALILYRPHEVFSWLNMTLAHNYGAAFSFLSSAGGWQRWFFITLASVVSLVLLVWLIRLPRREWLTGLGLALVLGGAVGNLVDRVRLGYVVDFIDVHFRGWHYPAFNVADSAITCGVALLIIDVFLISMRREEEQ